MGILDKLAAEIEALKEDVDEFDRLLHQAWTFARSKTAYEEAQQRLVTTKQ